MRSTSDIFGAAKSIIGMVHIGALPGTPRGEKPVVELARQAADEARLLADAGFDSIILENMHDAPYLRRVVGPEIVAGMAQVAAEVRRAVTVPLGIQILAGANREAIAVAHACGLQYVRAEGFVFASVADEGLLEEADAGPLLRYRKAIGAEQIAVLADIKKKHSAHAITQDVSLGESVHAAEFFGADGVIVTGQATAHPTSVDDLRGAKQATKLPVVVGSGATPDSLEALFANADAVIVGSWFKKDGDWRQAPDAKRVKQFVDAARKARK